MYTAICNVCTDADIIRKVSVTISSFFPLLLTVLVPLHTVAQLGVRFGPIASLLANSILPSGGGLCGTTVLCNQLQPSLLLLISRCVSTAGMPAWCLMVNSTTTWTMVLRLGELCQPPHHKVSDMKMLWGINLGGFEDWITRELSF